MDIRRFCGYAPNPPGAVTPEQFAQALTTLANDTPGPVSPQAVQALIEAFANAGIPVTGDPVSAAIAILAPEQVAVVRTVYLANLYPLETAIVAASATLNVDMSGPFKRNAAELREREGLFRSWRIRLCQFLGIDTGDFLDALIPAAFTV